MASATPGPLRDPVTAQRAEVRREVEPSEEPEGGRELRRPGSVNLVEDTQVWSERVRPIARPPAMPSSRCTSMTTPWSLRRSPSRAPTSWLRTRLGLTVDQFAERTRIRPHVIESIEVDDFAPCGGGSPVATFGLSPGCSASTSRRCSRRLRRAGTPTRRSTRGGCSRPSSPPASGSIRGTRGGPNWSVLVAAVMALVLAWSVARLIMDSPVELRGAAPILNGSAGVDNSPQQAADPVPVVLSAAGGGARVIVRDGAGKVVFTGNLAFGETKTLQVAPPVRLQSSDGSLETTIAGEERGALGATGEPAQNTFPVR